MPEPSESLKQSLRYLAAARFYLAEQLKPSPKYGADQQYLHFLHQSEYGLALDEIKSSATWTTGEGDDIIGDRGSGLARSA